LKHLENSTQLVDHNIHTLKELLHILYVHAGIISDYQERIHIRGTHENTDVKETDPLLPLIDDDTRDQFARKNLIISNECLILGEIIGQGI
jgi:hypothetical protein